MADFCAAVSGGADVVDAADDVVRLLMVDSAEAGLDVAPVVMTAAHGEAEYPMVTSADIAPRMAKRNERKASGEAFKSIGSL
jgi:hypothetical protein